MTIEQEIIMSIFNNIHPSDGDITYLCEYIPVKRTGYAEQDVRSRDFVLAFKDQETAIVKSVADYLYPNLGDDFAIAAFPSSKVEKNFRSAPHALAREIIERAEEDSSKENVIDASSCLYRFADTETVHMSSGARTPDRHLNSIEVRHPDLVRGKDVLVIDDVTTSGSSIKAACELLHQAGARKVVGFVVGKTIQENNLRTGFIFDLDQTLFNTEPVRPYREAKDWDTACNMARELSPYDGIPELLDAIRRLPDSLPEIYVVTNSPHRYADILAAKLGIRPQCIVAYNDVSHPKPDPEGLFRAKQRMQLYEECIVAVGDDDMRDISPARRLGMTTVLAGWSGGMSSVADFKPATPREMTRKLGEIVLHAEEVRQRLKY